MPKKEKSKEGNETLIVIAIVIFVIIFGVLGVRILEKLAVNNMRICNYLGGLWERKDTDTAHRCYTYEEFYSKP